MALGLSLIVVLVALWVSPPTAQASSQFDLVSVNEPRLLTGVPRESGVQLDFGSGSAYSSWMYGTGYINHNWGNQLSVAFWFNIERSANSEFFFQVFESTGRPSSFVIFLGLNLVRFYVGTSQCPIYTTTAPCSMQVSTTLSPFAHYSFTYDGSQKRIFINGVNIASYPLTGTILASDSPLELVPDYDWSQLSDVRLYSRSLIPNEVQTLANLAQAIPDSLNSDLIALYDFSDPFNLGLDTKCKVPLAIASASPTVISTSTSSTVTVIGQNLLSGVQFYLVDVNGLRLPCAVIQTSGDSATLLIASGLACGSFELLAVNGGCQSPPGIARLTTYSSTLFDIVPSLVAAVGGELVQVTSPCISRSLDVACSFNFDGDVMTTLATLGAGSVTCLSPVSPGPLLAETSLLYAGSVLTSSLTLRMYTSPVVNAVSPTTLSTSGGLVTATGKGFSGVDDPSVVVSCLITPSNSGVITVPGFIVSDTTLTCTVPRLPPGMATLQIVAGVHSSDVLSLQITPGALTPSRCVPSGGGLCTSPPYCQLCSPSTVTVTCYDENQFPVQFTPSDSVNVACAPTTVCTVDQSANKSTFSIFYSTTGTYSLHILVNGDAIPNSPFASVIQNSNAIVRSLTPASVAFESTTEVQIIGSDFYYCGLPVMCSFTPLATGVELFIPASLISDQSLVCATTRASTSMLGLMSVSAVIGGDTVPTSGSVFVYNQPTITGCLDSPCEGPMEGNLEILVLGTQFVQSGWFPTLMCQFGSQSTAAVPLTSETVTCQLPRSVSSFPSTVSLKLQIDGAVCEECGALPFKYVNQSREDFECHCSNHGVCDGGVCFCHFGYSGANCSTPWGIVVLILLSAAVAVMAVALLLLVRKLKKAPRLEANSREPVTESITTAAVIINSSSSSGDSPELEREPLLLTKAPPPYSPNSDTS